MILSNAIPFRHLAKAGSSLGPAFFIVRNLHWPACPNPTPYQIFGLDPSVSKIDKKQLRNIYFQLVKLYHPDRGVTGNAEKFKKVVEAHEILRNDTTRRTYDRTGSASPSSSGYQYQPRYRSSYQDDMDFNYWSKKNQQEFDEGLYENRIWVLKLVVTVTVVFAILNLILMKEASTARSEALDFETERAAAQLAMAASNRGRGLDAAERIRRFLDDRQRMLERVGYEFRWQKLKGGERKSTTSKETSTNRGGQETGLIEDREKERPVEYVPKRHSGPVAEYFGRS